MRDELRIEIFCKKLAKAWYKLPDWRFFQLIINFISDLGYDPFDMEEEEAISLLEQYCERLTDD